MGTFKNISKIKKKFIIGNEKRKIVIQKSEYKLLIRSIENNLFGKLIMLKSFKHSSYLIYMLLCYLSSVRS